MEKDQISKCYLCGNYTMLKLIQEIEVEEDIYDEYNEYLTFVFNYYYLNVKKTYLEAKKVQQISPVSFLMLIRKSLEQICTDQNAVGYSLYKKIEDLMARRIIPNKVAELIPLIRKIGNMSAHQHEYFDIMDVDYVDEFFSMISYYIYSIDAQVETLKSK